MTNDGRCGEFRPLLLRFDPDWRRFRLGAGGDRLGVGYAYGVRLDRRGLEHTSLARNGLLKTEAELAESVAGLFAGGLRDPRPRTEAETARLVSLTTLVVRARSAVERDGYTREIVLIPDSEAPTRLAVVLSRLLAGLDSIGVDRAEAWEVIVKAGLDSIPALRRAVIDALRQADEPLTTSNVAEALDHPTRTTERALEDLTAHGIVTVQRGGSGKRNLWELSEWAQARHAEIDTSPEMSGDTYTPINPPTSAYDDISGEVGENTDGAWDSGHFTVPPEPAADELESIEQLLQARRDEV